MNYERSRPDVRIVFNPENELTEHERAIVRLTANGQTREEIADSLGVSPSFVGDCITGFARTRSDSTFLRREWVLDLLRDGTIGIETHLPNHEIIPWPDWMTE